MEEQTKYPYSVHSFMLPLRWDYLPKGYDFLKKGKNSFHFEERTDMQKINDLLHNSGWKRNFYKINNDVVRYNENSYFHSYASKTLFDLQQFSEKNEKIVDDNKVMAYYEIEIDKNEDAFYKITTTQKSYTLKLTDINLHVYSTGVLILAFVCENYYTDNEDDILKINEYGRRFYPPFLIGNNGLLTKDTKSKVLASSIEISCINLLNKQSLYEDFSQYDSLVGKDTYQYQNGSYELNNVVELPRTITGLFNYQFAFDAKSEAEQKVRFNILGDDRMFFMCWYGNNSLAKLFKTKSNPENQTGTYYSYENSKYWYAFMNGDANSSYISLEHDQFLIKDIANNTNARWANYGTLYGFTRDSFVVISEDIQTLINNGAPNLFNHTTSIYYQMSIISLAQRASILRFSSEVTNLADLGKTNEEEATRLIEKLYLNYIEFINKIYFREITPQIQGIEMYEQFQKVMCIEKDANSLKEEIQELYNFAQMVKQDKLSTIATWFLPFSVVFGILGANFFTQQTFGKDEWPWLFKGIALSILISLVILKKGKIQNFLKNIIK